jgi:hypothetical protein
MLASKHLMPPQWGASIERVGVPYFELPCMHPTRYPLAPFSYFRCYMHGTHLLALLVACMYAYIY